jgi:hypothetical protein
MAYVKPPTELKNEGQRFLVDATRPEPKFSLAELARQTGEKPQTVSSWFHGKTRPNRKSRAILKVLIGVEEGAWDLKLVHDAPANDAKTKTGKAA